MRVALLNTFAANKKEPLAAMMDRIHHHSWTQVWVNRLSDSTSVTGRSPALSRVSTEALKRHPGKSLSDVLKNRRYSAELRIAFFVCPEGEKNGGKFVHFGRPPPILERSMVLK